MRYITFILICVNLLFADTTRTFTDMNGKSIVLPKKIERVFGSAPPISFMIYVLNDKALIGVNFPQTNGSNKNGKRFLTKHFMKLPIVGGWHGNNMPNLEEILAAKPQVIITWDTPLLNERTAKDLARISIPAVKVNIDSSYNYPQVFHYLGEVLNHPQRGDALAKMAKEYLDELKSFTRTLKQDKKTRVYYAEGISGLQTECSRSFHSEPFIIAGANLVHKCVQSTVIGMQQISFEQVLLYNPQVIITDTESFYKKIFTDKKWQTLDAVKNKRVYLIPNTPFNWLDRPPSFMRIIGAHWIASKLYPKTYPYDIRKKVKDYYKLFFKVNLTDEQLSYYFNL
jgi:iron complex transport system substrate-binding protein